MLVSSDSNENRLAVELHRLRTLRKETLRDVEKATQISNAYLSQLERGVAKNPTAAVLHALAVHYGVPYEHLMDWAGYIQSKPTAGQAARRATSSAEYALKSVRLSKEEDQAIADYIKFVVSRQKR